MSSQYLNLFQKPRKNYDHPDYKPHPFRRPGPQANETRITDIPLDIKIKVFNFASKSIPQDKKVNWSDIRGLAISDSGQSGVIFVETENGSIVVKGNPNIAIATFMHNLCEILHIPVPERKVVQWHEPEFKIIVKELQRASFSYQDLHSRIRSRLDRPYLEVLEYIPGISVQGMGPKRAQKIMSYYDPKSRHRMIHLGICLAFDIFINNSQRYPLAIWNNQGDVEHMIVRTDPSYLNTTKELRDPENMEFEYENFYALDHRPMVLEEYESEKAKFLLQQYYSNVEDFLNCLFFEMKSVMHAQLDPLYETKEQKIESIEILKKFIYEHTLFEMKEMTLLQIMLGIILCMDNIATLGIQRIDMLYNSVFKEENEDYKGIWNQNLSKISMGFLSTLIFIFKKFLGLHQDVLKWCKDVTLNQYSFDENAYIEILKRNPKMKQQLEEEEERIRKEKEEQFMVDKEAKIEISQSQVKKEGGEDDDECMDDSYLDDDALNKRIKEVFDLDLNAMKLEQKQQKNDNQSKSKKK